MSVERANEALRSAPVVDLGQLLKGEAGRLLKPGGRAEVEEIVARLARQGRKAHVVVTPHGDALAPYKALWELQKYDSQRDLLLLFNGVHWDARGWNLSAPAISSALAVAQPALRQYYGRGLTSALANLSRAAGEDPDGARAPRSSSSVGTVLLGAGGVAAAATVGWVILRRRRLARGRRQTLAEARSAADQVFADVVLATEDMSGPEAAQLRDKATRLRDQIDALAPPNLKQLPAKEESLTMAQLRQMENELEALRSRVLQVKRRP